MLKLYKKSEQGTLYWEAWEADDQVVVHHGQVGQTGESLEIEIGDAATGDGLIERESQQPRADGYAEIDIEDHAEIVVQFKTKHSWGDREDLAKRHEVDDLLDECLGWTGNGHCDGGDIGSGTINSYCFVIEPHVAARTIVEALRNSDLLEGAVIALAKANGNVDDDAVNTTDDDATDGDEADYEVLWPEDFTGDFSPMVLNDLEQTTESSGPLTPPWIMYKDVARDSSQWKSGDMAAYLLRWQVWFQAETPEIQKSYPAIFPEPSTWSGFYQAMLDY